MMKLQSLFLLVLLMAPAAALGQEQQALLEQAAEMLQQDPSVGYMAEAASAPPVEEPLTGFERAAASIQQQLEDSLAELTALRDRIIAEKLPLSRQLNDLESELVTVRGQYQQTTRLLDSRTLDLSNLRTEIKSRQEEATYLSNLLGEYIRNFESRLHIAEIQRYRKPLEEAKLAVENSSLTEEQVYQAQAALLATALERLEDALGGARFEGAAVDASGLVKEGTFVIIGPAALFQSADGQVVGTVEQRLGSLEPSVVTFGTPEDAVAASQVLTNAAGSFPFDPTMGNAHKIEQTKETLLSHVKKGGVVMYPIFALAGAALLVAMFKWLGMLFIRTPSQRRITALLANVAEHDAEGALQKAQALKGPVGTMLAAGVEHLKEPVELIEEVMYEQVMNTRLKLERFLPFIAISAASAPLLGLLGTVTGIINTFKLITVFGSGDVKMLSGGISEALITTEFGLIVAIPSLLIHAFLSRKARSVVNKMEKAAVALVNQIGKTPFRTENTNTLTALTPQQIEQLLQNTHRSPASVQHTPAPRYSRDHVGSMMDPRVVSVVRAATVSEAIDKIRSSEIGPDTDAVFIVDERGKYIGHVLVRHLLTRPDHTPIESVANTDPLSVCVDTHKDQLHDLFSQHELISIPVVDHDGRLVGRVKRNGQGAVAAK